ncbi:MAG: alanine--glyoxylate aminotransferase family protein [SAR324 cluster bacterium]|nr:alanine--glyoxylate aminotransferase family protein [SAR324 cluster bacterium]
MKRVSLTPAVFHLPDRVNKISETYGQQPIVPRGPALKPILDRLREKVSEQLNVSDTHETVIFTAAGSGAIAAAVGSCIDERGILVIANDVYGHRQADFCEQLGIRTIRYALDPGEKPDIQELETLLQKHQPGTVGMVHGCTSVGLLNPVKEVGELTRKLNIHLIVDAIASVFVEEIDLTGWNINTLICSTNKGLHSNPDLCFCVVEKGYLEKISKHPGRIPYFDIGKTWLAQKNGGHPYTINIRALLEFEAALDDFIERGGLTARIQMYRDRLKILRSGYNRLGLKTFLKQGMAQQNIGTALYLPEGVNYDDLATTLAQWDDGCEECFEIYSAQGELSGVVFRIFNMGEYPLETYERFIHALEVSLEQLQA